ncbi:enoyl-CoA hydratase/isomerase family protein [Paraburkholderia silvatlantica]|uniref:enoyl-CoA hydratase/isomerase family protein n=1 Tax=Paraburkholderia silvatlantica TaxID=321895 RepID=UPI003751537A
MKTNDALLVEHMDDGVTVFTINREARRNAICSQTAITMQREFESFEKSDQRVAVLTGTGTAAFCGGADVDDLPELFRCIPTVGFRSEKPIICAVSGWCVGAGLTLATMCDLVVASEDAKFYYPEARLGIAQGMIATLAARIPHKLAMEVMLLARVVSARRAYEMGFVNQVAPEGKHLDAALEMARDLAGMAPMAHRLLKRFVTEGVLVRGPTETFGIAKRDIDAVGQSEDLKEGFLASKEKRKPRFIGR